MLGEKGLSYFFFLFGPVKFGGVMKMQPRGIPEAVGNHDYVPHW